MKNKITNYLFEIGMLKKILHNGPQCAGVKRTDTVAEHVYRAAVIGYILGELEGLNGEKVASVVLFHDNPESRIGDHNKVAQRYIDRKKAEKVVLKDQIKNLPPKISKKIEKFWHDIETKSSKEAFLAYEADLLETALQAKEYADCGHPTLSWLDNVKKYVKSKSAKILLKEIYSTHFTDWWQGLKK